MNRNNVKVSYSCMPNIASHISSHNIKTIEKSRLEVNQRSRTCNCVDKEKCPLGGNCLATAIVYQANIKPDEDDEAKYIGLCEPIFKGRYGDHKTSCSRETYRHKTELSNFVWDKKEKGQRCEINFSILKKSSPYRAGSNKCNLCLWEKLLIMKGDDTLVNKREELVTKCRHVNKFLLRKKKKK